MTEITPEQVNDYATGKVELKELVGITTEYWQLLLGRTQFFLDGEHTERALIMLEMLEELDRKDPLPTLIAVELLLKEGRSDAAEEKIELLRARFGESPEVRVAQAELLVQVGQMVPAAEILEGVLNEDPEATTDAGKRARALVHRAHRLWSAG